MRARNLKPGLFKNEILGNADPLLTILFAGLWCEADREGRLLDRPLRLCAEIFPYRRRVNAKKMDEMLAWLDQHGFVLRYALKEQKCIQIIGFLKHQRPHKNESRSVIDPPPESAYKAIHRVDQLQALPRDGSEPDQGSGDFALTPSSLTPDSGLLTDECSPCEKSGSENAPGETASEGVDKAHQLLKRIQPVYPRWSGRQDWITPAHHIGIRLEQGATEDSLFQGVVRYGRWCVHEEIIGTRKVMAPSTFFSAADQPWAQRWELGPKHAKRKSFDERMAALQGNES